jgi:hypothetical protein
MLVLESFCRGKRTDQALCEDLVFADENFVAVIDGVSDKSGLDYGGLTGGRWAALTIAAELSLLSAPSTLADAEARLTARLASGQRELHPNWSEMPPAGATLVCYSRIRHEIWRIGDGHYAIDGVANHGVMQIDEIALAARWAYVECLRHAGMSDCEIADDQGQMGDLLRPLLAVQHHLANFSERHPLAYGVLNGHPVPDHLRETARLDTTVREVAMSSDGYPRLFATLDETERYLASDVHADPLRVGRHRGFAAVRPPLLSYDDRAYVRLAVS